MVYVCFRIANFPAILRVLNKYGSIVVPIVFIALGISIILHGDSIEYLVRLFGKC